jgi:hypothetical protein
MAEAAVSRSGRNAHEQPAATDGLRDQPNQLLEAEDLGADGVDRLVAPRRWSASDLAGSSHRLEPETLSSSCSIKAPQVTPLAALPDG